MRQEKNKRSRVSTGQFLGRQELLIISTKKEKKKGKIQYCKRSFQHPYREKGLEEHYCQMGWKEKTHAQGESLSRLKRSF